MKRKTMTTGLLAMGIVIALATLGLVVGNWAQSLSINGSVETGSLNVVVNPKLTEDFEGAKDIGKCNISVEQQSKKVDVSITNAYPGYQCHFWTNIVNKGSLAVATDAALSNNDPTAISVVRSADIPADAGSPTDPKGDCINDNLHAGQTEYCDWTVTVLKGAPGTTDGAQQGGNYGFSIKIDASLPQ